jgi:hypothetical protein
VVVKLHWHIGYATGTHREYNSSFTTEPALNALSRSHSLVYLRLLLRVQPAFWHTFTPSQYDGNAFWWWLKCYTVSMDPHSTCLGPSNAMTPQMPIRSFFDLWEAKTNSACMSGTALLAEFNFGMDESEIQQPELSYLSFTHTVFVVNFLGLVRSDEPLQA